MLYLTYFRHFGKKNSKRCKSKISLKSFTESFYEKQPISLSTQTNGAGIIKSAIIYVQIILRKGLNKILTSL